MTTWIPLRDNPTQADAAAMLRAASKPLADSLTSGTDYQVEEAHGFPTPIPLPQGGAVQWVIVSWKQHYRTREPLQRFATIYEIESTMTSEQGVCADALTPDEVAFCAHRQLVGAMPMIGQIWED